MNLQSILFLNHEMQGLLLMYDDKRYLYRSSKVDKNCSKNTQNSTIMHFFFSSVLFVAMTTRHMNLQSSLFLYHEIQGLLFMYVDERYLYRSTKVAINWLKNS